jgi:uncharacterized protein YndB with AHSA1/START domain
MNFELRPEDLSFLDTAPETYVFDAIVEAPRSRVFAAISADPSTWTWFPGLSKARYEGDGPPGLGSKRVVHMSGTAYHETMIAWEEPSCWAYRVDASSAPLAHALVEQWALHEHGPNGEQTRVQWTFAIEPRALFKAGKVAASTVMGTLFRKAMANLSDHLEHGTSSPTGTAAAPRPTA